MTCFLGVSGAGLLKSTLISGLNNELYCAAAGGLVSFGASFTVNRGLACYRLLTFLATSPLAAAAVSVEILPIFDDSLNDSKSAGYTCLIELLKLSGAFVSFKTGAGWVTIVEGLAADGDAVGEVSNWSVKFFSNFLNCCLSSLISSTLMELLIRSAIDCGIIAAGFRTGFKDCVRCFCG